MIELSPITGELQVVPSDQTGEPELFTHEEDPTTGETVTIEAEAAPYMDVSEIEEAEPCNCDIEMASAPPMHQEGESSSAVSGSVVLA